MLVVDDDAKVRDILARILQRAGHSVTGAASGEEALARFAPRRYDLVFTDLSLAGMGGEAFLRRFATAIPRPSP